MNKTIHVAVTRILYNPSLSMKSLTAILNVLSSFCPAKQYCIFLCISLAAAFNLTAQTTDVFFEGFETSQALDNWSADQGTWLIGRPASGPRSAHEGTNCASLAITGGDYPINVNSRLIGPALLVPDASENPRLRFWHWFSIGGGDHATVEIRTVGSATWRTLSPDYGDVGNFNLVRSGGIWTRPSLDLSTYAGQAVQIAFRFTSDSGSAIAPSPGWLIDEVAIISGSPMLKNPETFEDGLGDWNPDHGTWQVGAASSGPRVAHEGTNCASLATISASYPINVDSRLISPPLIVPAGSQNPRLRFWHWYSIGGGDHATVEIKPVGSSTWKVVSTDYGDAGNFNLTPNGGGIWTRPALDLRPYAGQSIQIAFHFVSDPGSAAANNPGWLIDELTVVTGPLVSRNPESFESGLGDWNPDRGTWQVARPSGGPGSAHDGTNCASLATSGANYPIEVDSRLISPPFVVPIREENARLRFWHWFSIGGGDHATVEIKPMASTTWTTLSPDYGDAGNLNIIHTSSGWTRPSLDLMPYAGQLVQIAFHFISDPDSAVAPNGGWYIDEVQVFHEFGLQLLGSPIVRSQNNICIPLELAASSPPSTISFVLQAPAGNLSNPVLSTEECWTGTLTAQVDSGWLVKLENSCGRVSMGPKTIGSICFTTVSQASAFVPLTFDALTVTNSDNSQPSGVHLFGTRAIVIAGEPLLESWLDGTQQRMVTIYGVPGKSYKVVYNSEIKSINHFSTWTPLSNSSIPATLFSSFPLGISRSTDPQVYLGAIEQ